MLLFVALMCWLCIVALRLLESLQPGQLMDENGVSNAGAECSSSEMAVQKPRHGSYYAASMLECLLGVPNCHRQYKSVLLKLPPDIAIHILRYVVPLRRTDLANFMHSLDSLYRYEKVYGLKQYFGQVTFEQIKFLDDMEAEVNFFLKHHPSDCGKLLHDRRYWLGELGYSLWQQLGNRPPCDMYDSLFRFYWSPSKSLESKQAAINAFVDSAHVLDDFMASTLYVLIVEGCENLETILRFLEIIPETAVLDGSLQLLASVPFLNCAEISANIERLTHAERIHLSNLLILSPRIVDISARMNAFGEYNKLFEKLTVSPMSLSKLRTVNLIRYGSLAELCQPSTLSPDDFFPSLFSNRSSLYKNVIAFLHDREDLCEAWEYFRSTFMVLYPSTIFAFSPIDFFRLFEVSDFRVYYWDWGRFIRRELYIWPASSRLSRMFQGLVECTVKRIALTRFEAVSIIQFRFLQFALFYSFKMDLDDMLLYLSNAVVSIYFTRQHTEGELYSLEPFLERVYHGVFGKMFFMQQLQHLLQPTFDAQSVKIAHEVNYTITRAILMGNVDILQIAAQDTRLSDSILLNLQGLIYKNCLSPGQIASAFQVLGFTRDDMDLAMQGLSRSEFLNKLFSSARAQIYLPYSLPHCHALLFYLWTQSQEPFKLYFDKSIVDFYDK